ncbi:shufflon protein [Flavobacteriaceae bacterium UJ101]|nr:shufflon protein [Flavobacteriaceae bacterium UJ101]APD07414.1 shufflon protein [Flavobacteriaceae bacterium UJ101]
MKTRNILAIAGIALTHIAYSQNIFPKSGNVGIGTTSPKNSLEIYQSSGEASLNLIGNDECLFSTYCDSDISNIQFTNKNTNVKSAIVGVKDSKNVNGMGIDFQIGFNSKGKPTTLSTLYLNSQAQVGIGTKDPLEKLHLNGSIRGNIGTGALRIKSGSGYIDVGAQNTSWAHIYTDRAKFIFNKDIYSITNGFSSYDNDLILRTKGSEKLRITDETGNVGIGTTTPTYKLETRGDIYANGGWLRVSGNSGVFFQTHGGGFQMTDNTWIRTYGNKNFYHNTGVMRTDGTFQVGSGGARMLVKTDGKVGIGTTNPDQLLTVNGNIHAKEVFVDTEGPLADYVFEQYYEGFSDLKPSYEIPTLKEVESYTKAHKHLPGIPTAKEVKEKGLSLGTMSNLLLEKIEELTLYTIDQEKNLERLNQENEILKNRLEKIELLLSNPKVNSYEK